MCILNAGITQENGVSAMIMRRLSKMGDDFTELEKQLTEYVLRNAEEVVYMTTKELADKVYVSQSTVSRFCKKLGFDNFWDFKVELAAELNEEYIKNQRVDVNRPFKKGDSNKTIAENIAKVYTQTILNMRDKIDYELMEKIINIFSKRKNIVIYGVGSSLTIAGDFSDKMSRIGYNVVLCRDFPNQFYKMYSAEESYCALIISYSGETPEMKIGVKAAKMIKVPVIAITANRYSWLGKTADFVISIISDEEKMMIAKLDLFSSQMAIHYILDCLYAFAYACNYDKYEVFSKKSEEILRFLRNQK